MYVHTYVRMYVCMYVCIYVCMYVCMYVWYVYTYVCVYVCMYVHIIRGETYSLSKYMYVCIRKNWSNEACIDTLKLGIRYAAAKVLKRAQKVVNCCTVVSEQYIRRIINYLACMPSYFTLYCTELISIHKTILCDLPYKHAQCMYCIAGKFTTCKGWHCYKVLARTNLLKLLPAKFVS